MAVRQTSDGRPRSVAWVYYLIITVLLVVLAVSTAPAILLLALLTGVYTAYLFRGGRFVLWIW